MDISEDYIKMCNCLEIQEVWVLNPGDAIYRSGIVYWLTSKGRTRWISHKKTIDDIYTHSTFEYFSKDSYIWLPRQDQLQDMFNHIAWETSTFSIWLACNFAKFCGIHDQDAEGSCNIHIRKGSMEQLWLAFVMFKLYEKKWSGETWVK